MAAAFTKAGEALGDVAHAAQRARSDVGFSGEAGRAAESLQRGVAANPQYTYAQTTAIGHSWGLANITASEGAGAHYDQVISLSGAWMPEGWAPDPSTTYRDCSYPDILQYAQEFGVVGENNVPRRPDSGFSYDPYYEAPSAFDLFNNHNLIATDSQANKSLLNDVRWEIFG
ncbi:hypothetical protein [Leifsonia aquatica]|uniref:hypothetical protein n=1 Tax=Leifsonia aquatica TaxID=144185 RepID=UPI003826199B